MQLTPFFVPGLGHASYLLGADETREAAVLDPGRDIAPYLDTARAAGLTIRFVLETHVHNDFLSGAQQLAACSGAEHIAASAAGLQVAYHGVHDGDLLTLGELTLLVRETPGHTPEHLSYVVSDTGRGPEPALVFTGGDLLVGGVGRVDLLGPELAEQLAPQLYDSLHQTLLALPDYVTVLPTHGAGSLCGTGSAGTRLSTIGYERATNPALQYPDKPSFVRAVRHSDAGIPTYYQRMRPANQARVPRWDAPAPIPLAPAAVEHTAGQGALVLDTRSNTAFGGGHLPGALNIALGESFATWVGWLEPEATALVLVLERAEQWAEAVTQLARIGYTRVAGLLQGGMDTWIATGRAVAHVPQRSVGELHALLANRGTHVLDVRMQREWRAGHISGARHVMLAELSAEARQLDRSAPLAVICGSGYRSSIATSLLLRQGFTNVTNVLGGMTAWQRAGYPTTTEEHDDDDDTTERVRIRTACAAVLP